MLEEIFEDLSQGEKEKVNELYEMYFNLKQAEIAYFGIKTHLEKCRIKLESFNKDNKDFIDLLNKRKKIEND